MVIMDGLSWPTIRFVLKRSTYTALRLVARLLRLEVTKQTSEAVRPPYVSDKRKASFCA